MFIISAVTGLFSEKSSSSNGCGSILRSIAYYALRNNIVNASLATWYNYIHKLGWERPKISKKSKYGIGIRANRPHQVWHADIRVVKCLNGMKYYVYLLMDNFSRFILNYQVSEKVSAKIRIESIKDAFEQYIKIPGEDVRLIVKGGVENNNHAVDDYINSEKVTVQKLIAGKDIKFSNSIVEAQNKIIKYRYLFKHDFKNIHELRKLLDWIRRKCIVNREVIFIYISFVDHSVV